MTLRVRYDGRVLVPEGPVDLPTNEIFEIEVRRTSTLPSFANGELKVEMRDGLPVIIAPPETPVLTSEDVKRFESEET